MLRFPVFAVLFLLGILPSFSIVQAQEVQRKCVALTFDDGPSQKLTPELLAILHQANVSATFYLVGERAAQYPNIVRDIYRNGHEIGNHSWDHPDLRKLTPEAVRRQIQMTDSAISAIIGSMPVTIRAPYGAVNEGIKSMFRRAFVRWDVDTRDWQFHSPENISAIIRKNVRPGSVILMHDTHVTTVAAIPRVIRQLQSAGYSLVTISELLSATCRIALPKVMHK